MNLVNKSEHEAKAQFGSKVVVKESCSRHGQTGEICHIWEDHGTHRFNVAFVDCILGATLDDLMLVREH